MSNEKQTMTNQDTSTGPQTAPESMESLRQTNRQQQAALQAKGRMIDNMAYQIRTLSNAIIGFSDLLLTEGLSPDQLDYAGEINQAGKGLSELVNEVLDWARLESGRLQIVRSQCELRTILDGLERTVRSVATDKGITFKVQSETTLPQCITTDPERLLKCLLNLVANAIQYTTQGFVRVDVHPDAQGGMAYVRFDVVDSGKGVPSEKLATLFEPAMYEEEANAQVVMMLGRKLSAAAGLPLTRQLAELLGGKIEVQSEVGKGSTFSLFIPTGTEAVFEASLYTSDESSVKNPSIQSQEKKSFPILLVEDQESNRTVVRLMLQTMGYEVETAVDGQEAVEMALSRPYSLIFMDLKMPRMDGCQATQYLRSRQVKVPIVALSAMVLNADENQHIAELFDGFLTKPIDSEQLLTAVRKYAAAALNVNTAGVS